MSTAGEIPFMDSILFACVTDTVTVTAQVDWAVGKFLGSTADGEQEEKYQIRPKTVLVSWRFGLRNWYLSTLRFILKPSSGCLYL